MNRIRYYVNLIAEYRERAIAFAVLALWILAGSTALGGNAGLAMMIFVASAAFAAIALVSIVFYEHWKWNHHLKQRSTR